MLIYLPKLEHWLIQNRTPKVVSKALRVGKVEPLDADGHLGQLLLGYPTGQAPIDRLVMGAQVDEAHWLTASLVHLVPDLNAVWVRPMEECPAELLSAAHTFLKQSGLDCEVASNGQLFIRLEKAPAVRFEPLWRLAGVSMDERMPVGAGAKYWISLMSESQIVMRQALGQAQASIGLGLWFWGMGALSKRPQADDWVRSVWASSDALEALGHWLGVETHRAGCGETPALSDGLFMEWPADESDNDSSEIDSLERIVRRALGQLRWGRLKRLRLASQNRYWTITPKQMWLGR